MTTSNEGIFPANRKNINRENISHSRFVSQSAESLFILAGNWDTDILRGRLLANFNLININNEVNTILILFTSHIL